VKKIVILLISAMFALVPSIKAEEVYLNCNYSKSKNYFQLDLKNKTVITPYAEDYKYTLEFSDKNFYFTVELVNKDKPENQINLATVINRYTGDIVIKNYNLNTVQQEKLIKEVSQKIAEGKKNFKMIKEIQDSLSQFKPGEIIQGNCEKVKKEKKF
jgi:hypothetical protein